MNRPDPSAAVVALLTLPSPGVPPPDGPARSRRAQGRGGASLLFLLAGLALGLAGPARAQSVGLAVEMPLGSYYRNGTWVPVSCTLTNQGPPADVKLIGQIQEIGPNPLTRSYELSASLPSPANRRYFLYVRPPGFYGTRPLEVQLLQDRRVIAKQEPTLSALNEGDRLVAVITSQEGGLGGLAGTQIPIPPGSPYSYSGRGQTRVQVAYVKPELAPDRDIGYQIADLVVINGLPSGSLSGAQETALTRWVQAGGTLVVTGGDVGALRTPAMQALLPVRITGSATLDAASAIRRLTESTQLQQWSGITWTSTSGRAPSGAFVAVASRPKPGASAVEAPQGVPILASWPVGAGRVVFFAADPARPPFRGWDGLNSLWRHYLLTPNPAVHFLTAIEGTSQYAGAPGYYNSQGRPSSLASACLQVSQMDVPGFAFIGFFLVAYIVALVPLNYFLLKRRDRRELAWVTTPVIIFAFSGLAYLVGYGTKGGQVVLAQAGVVEAWAGRRTAPVVTYYGLFSPGKSRYDLSAAEGAVPLLPAEAGDIPPRRELRMLEGDQFALKEVPIDMWDMGLFRGDSLLDLEPGFAADLRLSQGVLSGQVTNRSPFDLEEVALVGWGRQLATWSNLRRGETRAVRTTVTAAGSGSLLPPVALRNVHGTHAPDRMRRAVLEPLTSGMLVTGYGGTAAVTPPSHPVLMGWVKRPLVPALVDGHPVREQPAYLFLVHLTVK